MAPEKFSGRLFIIKKSGVRVIVFFAVSHLQMEASPTITLPRTTPSKSVDGHGSRRKGQSHSDCQSG